MSPVIQELATSHPDIVALTSLPDPYPEKGAREWIDYAVTRYSKGLEFSFVIVEGTDKTVVEVCGLNVESEDQHRAELGYWIGAPYWGNGYATRAVQHALHFGFTGQGFELIYAKPLERNAASCRVLEKAGFRHTDTMPNDEPHTLKGDMLRIYEITSGEWHNQADTPELNCSYPRTDI